MSFFTRRKILALCFVVPLCEGAYWLYAESAHIRYRAHTWSSDGGSVLYDEAKHMSFEPQNLPNGDSIVPGWDTDDQEQIWLVNGKTHRGRRLVRGFYPLLSPKGDTLAYTDPRGQLRFLSL